MLYCTQEQTVEREQERDEYQQEIHKLQQQIKDREKQGSSEYRLEREVSAGYSQ